MKCLYVCVWHLYFYINCVFVFLCSPFAQVEKATHAALMDLNYPMKRMCCKIGALGETLYGPSCVFLTWFSQSNIVQEIVIDTDEPAVDEPESDAEESSEVDEPSAA